jgi:formylglycine-generating enzyme required for sulfatase activity
LFLGGCAISPELNLIRFVKIPAGQLDHACHPIAIPCGSTEEKKFKAAISQFELAEHETTVSMFRNFVIETGYVTSAEKSSDDQMGCQPYQGFWTNSKTWQAPGFLQTEFDPVVCLSLVDIQAYIAWLNTKGSSKYRLPTADEWRYVSLLAVSDIKAIQNTIEDEDNPKATLPVSTEISNALGLKGLQSNVTEVTSTCTDESCDEVVILGASFFDDNQNICEDYSIGTNNRLPFIGFRLVKFN